MKLEALIVYKNVENCKENSYKCQQLICFKKSR